MVSLFHRKTPEEILRENKRLISRAVRQLDSERLQMERQEKKLIADIKKAAKDGQMPAVKIMAKDLVRTRRYIRNFHQMKANVQAISMKLTQLSSSAKMAQAMTGVTKALRTMNRRMNLASFQKLIMEFERQNDITEAKEEAMNDIMDDALGGSDDEAETDKVVGQVLSELGLSLMDDVNAAPAGSLIADQKATPAKVPAAAAAGASSSNIDADLEERLNNLRRDDD